MIEMKNNNYFSMFKDAVIMICVFLYGRCDAEPLIPSPGGTHTDHLRHRAARVAGGGPQCGRLLDGQEGPRVGGEFRLSDANGNLFSTCSPLTHSGPSPRGLAPLRHQAGVHRAESDPGGDPGVSPHRVGAEPRQSAEHDHRAVLRDLLLPHHPLHSVQISLSRRSVVPNTTAIFVLIANSCYQEFRAKAYCLSQVLAGLLRFVVEDGEGSEN